MTPKYPKLLRNLVLVKIPKQTKSRGGLELPTSAVEEKKLSASEGVAVACGKECEEVAVGDKVMCKAYVGNDLDDDTFDSDFWYRVIAEDDIMAVYPAN